MPIVDVKDFHPKTGAYWQGYGPDEAGPCPDCNGTGKIPLDTAPESVVE